MRAKTRIQIVGADGVKLRALAERAEIAARGLALDFELERVVESSRILDFGLVATPALAVDGLVVVSGRLPTVTELRDLLRPISSSVA
jgi:hypothetical protein